MGEVEEKKKMNWVSWSKVCKSKDKGGLGVKSCEWFNLALLSKWSWRFLNEQNMIWYALLPHRYSLIKDKILDVNGIENSKKGSSRWKDLRLVKDNREEEKIGL